MRTWKEIEQIRNERLALLDAGEKRFAAFIPVFEKYLIEAAGCPADRMEVTLRRDDYDETARDLYLELFYTPARDVAANAHIRFRVEGDEPLTFEGRGSVRELLPATCEAVADAVMEQMVTSTRERSASSLRELPPSVRRVAKVTARTVGTPIGTPIGRSPTAAAVAK